MPGETAAALHRVAAVARHQAVLLRRSPGQVIVYTAMPVVLTLFLSPALTRLSAAGGGGRNGGDGGVAAGMLVLGSLFMAGVVGATMVDERVWRTAERLASTPARPLEVLVGKALPMLAVLLVQQVVVLGLAWPAHAGPDRPHPARVAAVGLGWAVFVLGLGAMMAAAVTTSAQLSTVKDLSALVLSGTGGAIVPLAALPGWVTPVARLSPAYWAVTGFTGSPGTAGTCAAVLAGAGTALFAGAAVTLPRRATS